MADSSVTGIVHSLGVVHIWMGIFIMPIFIIGAVAGIAFVAKSENDPVNHIDDKEFESKKRTILIILSIVLTALVVAWAVNFRLRKNPDWINASGALQSAALLSGALSPISTTIM